MTSRAERANVPVPVVRFDQHAWYWLRVDVEWANVPKNTRLHAMLTRLRTLDVRRVQGILLKSLWEELAGSRGWEPENMDVISKLIVYGMIVPMTELNIEAVVKISAPPGRERNVGKYSGAEQALIRNRGAPCLTCQCSDTDRAFCEAW